ncbi:MAG: Fe-S protein assembly chaperone HscA [Saprospiraceae bacterium]|nr:Fe-S protein assembly chaperone HscA [Saprospiraceae bacterium]
MAKIPINFKTGELLHTKELVVGIDLGTTNSLIAAVHEGKSYIIRDHCGKELFVPSVIHFLKDGTRLIGNEAKDYLTKDSGITIYSVKRLLGKSFHDLKEQKKYFGYQLDQDSQEGMVRIKVYDKTYSPLELSAILLQHLKNEAEKSTGKTINKAVITVPAYFNDAQRQATRDAGKLAGLDVLRIINEPTAASLAYGIGLNRFDSSIVAVYDLGGGTFDISILRIEDGVFDVLSTRGDTYLGGDDFDQAIVDFWAVKYQFSIPEQHASLNQLRLIAEQVRKDLNELESSKYQWNEYELELNRVEFESCTNHLLSKTMDCVRLALQDAQLKFEDIQQVILVGGATRMNIVKNAVSSFFKKEVHTELHPDQAVALGAAIQADILSGGRKDMLLLDVNPLSLGIETLGGIMDVIIPRNSKIPTQLAKNYTTSKDGQTKLKISVFQGERDLVEHNRKLGEFILSNIPAMPLGIPKIEVTFKIDADGILQVKAKELRSETEQLVIIKSQFAITPEEITGMLKNSIDFAKADMDQKTLIDASNEAKMVISHTKKFIEQNATWLNNEDVHTLQDHIDRLETRIELRDKDGILQLLEELNTFASPLAHKAMDFSVEQVLKGKKV